MNIDDLGRYKTFVTSRNNVKYYDLTLDQMMLVGMRVGGLFNE